MLRLQRVVGNHVMSTLIGPPPVAMPLGVSNANRPSAGGAVQRDPAECSARQTQLVYADEPGRTRCISDGDSEFRKNYVDNDIVRATGLAVPGTTWANVTQESFPRILLSYKDNRTLTIDTSDIPLVLSSGAPRPGVIHAIRPLERYEKRADGFIYPIRSTGRSDYVSWGDAKNIVSLRAGLHDQIQELQQLFSLIVVTAQFAADIALLAGIAHLGAQATQNGGLFQRVRKSGASTAGDKGGKSPGTRAPGGAKIPGEGEEHAAPTPRKAPYTATTRTMSSATTTDIAQLKREGFVLHGASADGTTVTYRHPDTGSKVVVSLRQGGPVWWRPTWGRLRIESEMRARGFRLVRETRGEGGQVFRNPDTTEEIRIMPRKGPNANEPIEKHLNPYYFRYKDQAGHEWGPHTTLPDKE